MKAKILVLVIEDDPSSSRLVTYALEQEGYHVITASDGLEGLNRALKENIDLVILDVMLPGLDGYEVCQHLRQKKETARLPILMISAKGRETDKDTGFKVGANAYLIKPVDPSVIVAEVKTLLADKEKTRTKDSEYDNIKPNESIIEITWKEKGSEE